MPWSVADFSAFRLSVGESLLSMPTTSNFIPAGLFWLNFSTRNCQLFSWLLPTGAIRPDSGSIQAILTTWPSSGLAPALACAETVPADAARATPMQAASTLLAIGRMGLFIGFLLAKVIRAEVNGCARPRVTGTSPKPSGLAPSGGDDRLR